MRPHSLDNVGDEPIYCETQHDDVLYSGSEHDYYEAPEHRRLRIEAKAVQFLNGNLPYLLSAKLRGPFDAKSWNNPWKSKRAQRHAVQPESQSRRSVTTVEAARGHNMDVAIDDLPDTQRTSLYPLPSPETTNPPSARKNHFMAEEEYNRIKTWRETVKKVPLSTDPFWASQHGGSHKSTATRKRSAEQDWLRKRESKKRKSGDLRLSAPEESPSQAAAKTKRTLLPRQLAEIVTQSAPGSSTHEDELTAHWGLNSASFDTSRMANIPTKTPGVLHIAPKPQASARLAFTRDLELSEDELSMPSISPSRNASRSPPKKSPSSTANDTPCRLNNRNTNEILRTRKCVQEAKLDLNSNSSQRSASSKAGRSFSQWKRTSTSVSATQIAHQDMGEAVLDVSPMHIPASKGSARNNVMGLPKNAARPALGASQHDDSFYFHQAAPKTHSPPGQSPPGDQVADAALSLPSSRHGDPPTTNEHLEPGGDQQCAENDDVSASATSDDQMDLDQSDHLKPPSEMGKVTSTSDAGGKVDVAANLDTRATQPQVNDALLAVDRRSEEEVEVLRQAQSERLQICTNTEPSLSPHACTQELSPVSMQDKIQAAVGTVTAADSLTAGLTIDDADTLKPEWLMDIDKKVLPTDSEVVSSFDEAIKDTEGVSQGADDPNDPDWTTYVNTQDVTGSLIENGTASNIVKGLPVMEQGPDDSSDPEWSTFVDTQDQSSVKPRCDKDEVVVVEDGPRVDLERNDYKFTESATYDIESSSELPSYLSASSQDDANQTGNTSNEPVLAEDPAAESKFSQVSLRAIINAYAESDESQDDFEDCPKSQLPIGDQQGPEAANQCQDDRQDHEAGCGRLEETIVSTEDFEEAPAEILPVEQMDPPLWRAEELAFNFDGTTASLQSPVPFSSADEQLPQSPWVKDRMDLPMPANPNNDTELNQKISTLSLLAGQALAFSPAPQTPWVESRLPSPDFSMSVKRFSDFMKPSPSKKRASANGGIIRNSNTTSRLLFGTPMPAKPKRRVTFASLPGEEEGALATGELLKNDEVLVEDDLSYFDAKGNKTASIRITRSQTRAASPPPSDVNTADVDELPDHDHKFARHFEVMSQRKKDPPRKTQRLLPSESQQTNCSQSIDAMAEAFIQASQTMKKSTELVEAVDDNTRLFQQLSRKMSSATVANTIEQQENVDPVDDISAVLDNIDDFLDNSWGFDTSLKSDTGKEASTRHHTERIPSRFARVGDPMLAMHANVWAD